VPLLSSVPHLTPDRVHRIICVALILAACSASGQQTPSDPTQEESKRILGLVPNYRTTPSLVNYQPLTPGEKFKVASEDAFDRGTIALSAIFAGAAQLTNANRSLGQGGAGFGRYFGTSYGDFMIADYMTEAGPVTK